MSVVDMATNTVIGQPLFAWPEKYAASSNLPANQTKFSVTVPELKGKCATPGQCVGYPYPSYHSHTHRKHMCAD